MSLWSDIKQRRITQIVLSYLVGGWIILQVVDQVVDREVVPRYVYVVALILFSFGIPAALVIGWYHGEKGSQKATPVEVALLTVLAVAALGSSWVVVQDARTLARAQAGVVELSRIAVRYFDGEDDESRLMAESLTEDLIGRLQQVPELDVVSRNGARAIRGQDLSTVEAAEALDVGTLLEGDVEHAGEDFVVSVRIVTRDGVRLGNVNVRGSADDPVRLQAEVAQEVEEEFRATLGNEIRLREARTEAPNPGSWMAVARGERLITRGLEAFGHGDVVAGQGAFADAVEALEEGASLAEGWAEPRVLLSRVAYERARRAGSRPEMEGLLQEAVARADTAVALDPGSGEALTRRGTALYLRYLFNLDHDEGDRAATLARAQDDLEAATRADPTLAEPHSTLSHLYYQVGDVAQAALSAREAYRNDAFYEAANSVLRRLFTSNYDLERVDQAREWCGEGRRRFPTDEFFTTCQLWVMTMSGVQPEVERGWALVDSVAGLAEARPELTTAQARTVMGGILARAGLADSASAVMAAARVGPEVDPEGELLSLEAAMRLMNGEDDEAIALLQRYTLSNEGHFGQGRGLHWWWRPLQGNPEFERLRRLN